MLCTSAYSQHPLCSMRLVVVYVISSLDLIMQHYAGKGSFRFIWVGSIPHCLCRVASVCLMWWKCTLRCGAGRERAAPSRHCRGRRHLRIRWAGQWVQAQGWQPACNVSILWILVNLKWRCRGGTYFGIHIYVHRKLIESEHSRSNNDKELRPLWMLSINQVLNLKCAIKVN